MLAMDDLQIACPLDIAVNDNGAQEFRPCVLNVVRRTGSPDFSCGSLVLPGSLEYQLVHDDGFSQWIYLVCPESFNMALQCTSRAFFTPRYLVQSRAVCLGRALSWYITVNFLEAMCSAGGIRMAQRKFHLKFSCSMP
jgi:hypothetical protein